MTVTVIGAANVDIFTKSSAKIIHGDSNPAAVKTAPGGVARNIAENLSRLGADVNFITAVGDDPFGDMLRRQCGECGMNTNAWFVRRGMPTGVYIAALDSDGELYAAFNAMAVLETLSPKEFAPHAGLIASSGLLVLDTNLSEEAIGGVLDIAGGVPVLADTVSVAKAPRIEKLLPKIDTLKTNRAEASALTGLCLDAEGDMERACKELLSRGPRRVFITLGAGGVFAADSGGVIHIPSMPVNVKNVTGAGDSFSAGAALYSGQRLEKQAMFAAACAAVTLEADEAVSTALTRERAERLVSAVS